MTTRVDVEEIETTKSEKLLATVLAAFVLVALVWVYFHIDVERHHELRDPYELVSPADRAVIERHRRAADRARAARSRVQVRRRALVDRREAYRTALDEGRRDRQLEGRYRAAQAAYARAQRSHRHAQRAVGRLRGAARAAQRRVDMAVQREQRRLDRAQRHDGRVSFVRRLVLVLTALAGAYALLGRLRRRRSRYLPLAMGCVGAVALLALVMGVDYLTDYVEVTDVGVLVLSLGGVAMTLAAFAALQRYLARRTPQRRVRRGQCPFCGFPIRASTHCEGCGRDVIAPCSTCHAQRRVGTAHCGSCGAR